MDIVIITLSTQIINQVCPRCKEEFAIVHYQKTVDKEEGDFLSHRVFIVCANSACGKASVAEHEHILYQAIQQALKKYRANV